MLFTKTVISLKFLNYEVKFKEKRKSYLSFIYSKFLEKLSNKFSPKKGKILTISIPNSSRFYPENLLSYSWAMS